MDEKIILNLDNGIVTLDSKTNQYSSYCTSSPYCRGWSAGPSSSKWEVTKELAQHTHNK